MSKAPNITPPPPPPPQSGPAELKGAPRGKVKGSGLDLGSVRLKPTTVTVRLRDGTILKETKGENGEYQAARSEERAVVPSYLEDQQSGFSRLMPREYSATDGCWHARPLLVKGEPVKAQPCDLTREELTVISYNVWFNHRRKKERAQAMFGILEREAADIVCLQEVTPEFLEWLRDEGWVKREYILSDTTGTTLMGTFAYGVVMLVRKSTMPVESIAFTLHSLPTNMNRYFLLMRCALAEPQGSSLSVGTVHLESMDNADMRMLQLETIFGALNAGPDSHCILTGDMNFGDSAGEHRVIPEEFEDTWSVLNPSAEPGEGCTMPFDDVFGKGMRLDRIFCAAGAWRPSSFKLIGTEKILPRLAGHADEDDGDDDARDASKSQGEKKRIRFDPSAGKDLPSSRKNEAAMRPSDHFGVCCTFQPT